MESSNSQAYKPTRADYFFNMTGCFASALASLVLVIAITRIAGAEIGGMFSIAFTIAQLFMMVGNMGMRTFQASDLDERYSLEEYVVNRMVSCACMMGLGWAYCLMTQQQPEKRMVIMLVVSAKMIDAFADVFEGELQRRKYLRIAGVSLTIRMVLSTLTCLTVLAGFKSLVWACFALFISEALCAGAFSIFPVVLLRNQKDGKTHGRLSVGKACQLFEPAFPLLFSAFGLQLIASMPKYAIDFQMTGAAQAIYAILYLPPQAVSLISNFIFKPLVGEMAYEWQSQQYAAFSHRISRLLWMISGCEAVVFIAGALLGIPVLECLSGLKLKVYKTELLMMILGGAFAATSAFLLQAITIMRKQKYAFCVYVLMTFLSVFVDFYLVKRVGIRGAASGYLIQVAVLAVLLFGTYRFSLRKMQI